MNPLAASGDQHRLMRRAYGTADGYARLIGEALEAWTNSGQDLGAILSTPTAASSRSTSSPTTAAMAFCRLSLDPRRLRLFEQLAPRTRPQRSAGPYLDPATFRQPPIYSQGRSAPCSARRIGAGLGRLAPPPTAPRIRDAHHRRPPWTRPPPGWCTLARPAKPWTADQRRHRPPAPGRLKLMPDLAGTLTLCRTAVVYLDPPTGGVSAAAWANSRRPSRTSAARSPATSSPPSTARG